MRELKNSMMYLREFAKRASCAGMPSVTLEFDTPRDMAVFVAHLKRETLPAEVTPATRPERGQFEVCGMLIFTGVKGGVA